jgi:Domain of unknown function (DUF4412)
MTRRPRSLAGLAVAALVVLAATSAHAGYAMLDQQGGQTLVSKGRVKHTGQAADQPTMVFDVGRGRLWFANPRTRSYWEGTAEEYCTAVKGLMGSAVSEMEKQMKEQLAKLPPDQRAQTEQMMKQALEQMRGAQPGASPGKTPKVTVERTGEQATIAGQVARKHRVLADGQPSLDVWLASDAGLAQELGLARMPESYGRMAACLDSRPTGQVVFESPEYRQLYSQGWPLRIVSHEGGAAQAIVEIVKIERRDVPEAEFAPPAGYRKAPLPQVIGTP